MLIITLWSLLTIIFMIRLRTIMLNFQWFVTKGTGLLRIPKINARPLKQFCIWVGELMVLMFFYQAFGVSIIAHCTAAICGCALMLMLRERDCPFLEGLQLTPITI